MKNNIKWKNNIYKKIIIISLLLLSLLLFTSTVFSQNIKTYGVFETGYENRRTIIYQPDSLMYLGILPSYDLKPFFGYLKFGAEWRGIEAYTSNKTYFCKDTEIYFNPLFSEFRIGLKYRYKNISGGYEHMCGHSISGKQFFEGYDNIFVRVVIFGKPPEKF